MKKNVMMCILMFFISLTFVACGEKETDSSSLEGADLISSLNTIQPEKMKLVTEMSTSGMITKVATYTDGNKVRTETKTGNMPKIISIILTDENVMYQYMDGSNDGFKIPFNENSQSGHMIEQEDRNSLMAMIKNGKTTDMIAKKDKLDGEEVVYIETNLSDPNMGKVFAKLWYSEKYAIPLKYQIYANDELYMELKTIEVDDENIDASLFSPPKKVTFVEMSVDSLLEKFDDVEGFDNFEGFDDFEGFDGFGQ